MSVSHGYNTMGGVEYDDRDYVRKQKRRKSHTNAANQRSSSDVNTRSRDCHATDALDL